MHSDLLNTREDSRATRDHSAGEIISRSQVSALSRESCRCNLCGHDATQRVATQRGFEIHRCRICGLVYVSPRPKAEELPSLYADYHDRDGENEASWDRLMSRIFRDAADLLCAAWNGSRPPRLLDVGCGFGGFVALMKERGWDAERVDPAPPVVEAARRKGRMVRLGTLEALSVDRGPFDAVTMFYVLEHLSGGPLSLVPQRLMPRS